ncbi:MAG: NusA-like transcription termination signal-binding factor [Candidatus Methanomethyliaceae archaeon]|nr:NusA-like transcription termination signal-binding factor [Candidatus Methanomethyliaceae archaeon]
MRFIALLENLTGAIAKDCVVETEGNRIIFVIRPGDMGLAIGKNGMNIDRARKVIGRNVEIVEYAETPEEFLKNIVAPAKVRGIKITKNSEGNTVAQVTVDPHDKGMAIGKSGKNITKTRLLMKRHFDLNNVVII